MSHKKRIVIIGATSAIAEHCARLWIKDHPIDFILIGRDAQRIQRVSNDLKVRSPESKFQIIEIDFQDPQTISTNVNNIYKLGPVDIALIAHGSLPKQSDCQADIKSCQNALEINAISPALFAEAFAKHMGKSNYGTLAFIGSVAGDRGRKSNYVYGAAKGLVDRYSQGLRHRFANSKVNIILIKPGPTDTPMTQHIKHQGIKLVSVENVARTIVKGISQGKNIIYAPKKWWLIMMVIRHIPSFIFNKLNI